MENGKNKMPAGAVYPNEGNNGSDDNNLQENEEFDESITVEEYDILDAQIDELNVVLDIIEQKNDKMRSEFLELLHSNKQIREEFQQQNNKEGDKQQEEGSEKLN